MLAMRGFMLGAFVSTRLAKRRTKSTGLRCMGGITRHEPDTEAAHVSTITVHLNASHKTFHVRLVQAGMSGDN